MTAPEEFQSSEYTDEAGLEQRYLISPRSAQRWRATGEGPKYVRLGKRRILYRIEDVEAWLRDRTYCSHADEMSRSSNVA